MMTVLYFYLLMGGVVIFLNEYLGTKALDKVVDDLVNLRVPDEKTKRIAMAYSRFLARRSHMTLFQKIFFWVLILVLWLPLLLLALFNTRN
jgi:hypothetical protein